MTNPLFISGPKCHIYTNSTEAVEPLIAALAMATNSDGDDFTLTNLENICTVEDVPWDRS